MLDTVSNTLLEMTFTQIASWFINYFMETVRSVKNTFESFRNYLINEFERRKEVNQNYSLRAYAKSLDINPACLSVILRGKRPLTTKLVNKFSKRLKLGPEELESLVSSTEASEASSYKIMTFEIFQMLSEWHYDAICELIRLEDFKSDPAWISKELGVDVNKVNIAIERLVKYDFIDIDVKGNFKLLKEENDLYVDEFTSPGAFLVR